MAQKPSIPKGTRDFSPTEVAKRNYIFDTIRKSFENFGFQPIETPAFENSATLMGKYGEEGDRLIFKILDSGDFYEKKIEEKIQKSISIYIAMTDIFRKTVTKFLDNISDEFISPEEFKNNDYIDSIKNIFDKNSNMFLSLYIEEEDLQTKAKKVFKDERDNISEKLLDFVNKRALDVKPRRINSDLVESHLKFADRELVREISKDLFLKINKILPKTEEINSLKISQDISEKALRYDLTVPFARYVVQHQNEITFPFKRYQMQPVWRADRPQKGRFREFYQCDADVVGSKSLWQEVEFIQLYDDVFTKLGLTDTIIKINNRKILSGIAEIIGAQDKLIDFTVALDKIDKIGLEGITKEMLSKGITQEAIEKLKPLFNLNGTNNEKLMQLKGMLQSSDEGVQGVEELQFVIENVTKLGLQSSNVQLDVTLARGLNYYTGAIFEVMTEKVSIGSIGGGGRYDDLTGVFGLKELSGVGISFGLDRIYIVLEELGLFNEVVLPKPKLVFLNFDKDTELSKLRAIKKLRKNNIKCELYPDVAESNKQQKKQWKYITNRSIEFVVTNVEGNKYTIKNMNDGEQQQCSIEELLEIVKNL